MGLIDCIGCFSMWAKHSYSCDVIYNNCLVCFHFSMKMEKPLDCSTNVISVNIPCLSDFPRNSSFQSRRDPSLWTMWCNELLPATLCGVYMDENITASMTMVQTLGLFNIMVADMCFLSMHGAEGHPLNSQVITGLTLSTYSTSAPFSPMFWIPFAHITFPRNIFRRIPWKKNTSFLILFLLSAKPKASNCLAVNSFSGHAG